MAERSEVSCCLPTDGAKRRVQAVDPIQKKKKTKLKLNCVLPEANILIVGNDCGKDLTPESSYKNTPQDQTNLRHNH